jgi:hypothetical protein
MNVKLSMAISSKKKELNSFSILDQSDADFLIR